MRLVFKNKISHSTTIAILEIGDNQTDFSSEKTILAKSESRKKEITATNFLIKELCGSIAEIFYDENGKPHLKNSNRHISISHSYKYVAAILETRHETGIDIQKITQKISRVKEKFLSEKELNFIAESENKVEVLHVFWGAKECIFKTFGKGKIIFSENIFIEPFAYKQSGEIKSQLNFSNEKKAFRLHYEKWDDYILVYITDLINIVK